MATAKTDTKAAAKADNAETKADTKVDAKDAKELKKKEAMIVDTFKKFDKNQDGVISRSELTAVFKALGGGKFSDSDIDALMTAADTNKDGKIQYNEFVSWVMSPAKGGDDSNQGKFAPIDKRGKIKVTNKTLLPERFAVDVEARYSFENQVGEGGYGTVFIATDKEMNSRRVAVKKVTKTGCEKSTQSFYNEIQIMKDLDHPNICKLLGTFEQGREMYFIMELCEGGELFDWIITAGHIDEGFAADIVGQISSALAYAHGRHIAHRDIKPENVVFCTKESTQVKLIDWGLAMRFLGVNMASAVGSFTYAAPEVISSKNVTAYTEACDLWSLGVLTYVMLSGKPPFWGNHQQHLKNAKAEKYPMKGKPWDNMNPKAKDFVKRLLKANPKDRMPIGEVCQHPWLTSVRSRSKTVDNDNSKDILANLKHFSGASTFERLCINAVARQLDHTQLTNIHETFRQMDTNGDGVLCIKEIRDGFEKILGKDNADVQELVNVFQKMDLDGSDTIDYTEFCAAGLGQKTSSQDAVIWAAFKTFDTDNSGYIEQEDISRILDSADVLDEWTAEVCHEVAQEVVEKFGEKGTSKISFEDWKQLMQKCWHRSHEAPMFQKAKEGRNSVTEDPYALLLMVSNLESKDE